LTLINFKNRLKISALLIILGIYGLGTYFLGKYSNLQEKIQLNRNQNQKPIDAPINSPLPFENIQSGSVISSYVKSCSNTLFGFEVSYPKDWFTTYQTEEEKCTFFAPYSFVVPTQKDESFVPVKIEVVKTEDWQGSLNFYETPNDFQNIVSVENTQTNDKAVRKIKSLATGAGQIPISFVKLTYLVFDSKTPLIISYQQIDGKDNVESMSKNLEEMVASLRYF